jgi:YD repeat-containing protein
MLDFECSCRLVRLGCEFCGGREHVNTGAKILFVLTALGAAALAYATETITYSYDARGRLIRVVHNGSVNSNVSTNYAYDKADNRTLKNTAGAPQ